MTDVITGGQRDTLTATYTMSDGSSRPADDASWSEANDPADAATPDTLSGAVVVVTGNDRADGSLTAVVYTAAGSGFTASVEIDVQASVPAPTVTGLTITTSGPQS